MSSDVNLEQRTVEVKQFVVRDGDKCIPAGELLGALIDVADMQRPLKNINASQEVIDYLCDKDFITRKDGEYDVTIRQRQRCVDLGNKISDIIDEELSHLPKGTVIKLPTVFTVQSSNDDGTHNLEAHK